MELATIHTSAAEDGSLRLLQLTDTHLFANRGTGLLGVNTLESLRAVIAQVREDGIAFDWIVATGDISQDHSVRSYQRFVEEVSVLQKPVLWLPGNHDMQSIMRSTLDESGISAAKQMISDHWQLILLDTQVEGKPHGYLNDGQLIFLEQALLENPKLHTLILMHHQCRPIGCRWLDQHDLKNSADFHRIIDQHPQVKAVLFGHIHQNFEYQLGSIAYIATPSTCIQFLPLSDNFMLDSQQPGYRYLQLRDDGRISSRVKRLSGQQFVPDTQSKGY